MSSEARVLDADGNVVATISLTPPRTPTEVKAEQARLARERDTLKARQADGSFHAYRFRDGGFERVPSFDRKALAFDRQQDLAAEMKVRAIGARPRARESKPQGRRTRPATSRDGPLPPGDDSELPLSLRSRRLRWLAVVSADPLARCWEHEYRRAAVRRAAA